MIDQNTAEVLNKALDLAKQGVVSAFETVKQYAPVVWGMARRQTIIEGVEFLLGASIIGTLAGSLIKAMWWKAKINRIKENPNYRYSGYFDGDDAFIGTLVTVGVAAIPMTILLIIALPLLLNPDWETMQKVLELIKR